MGLFSKRKAAAAGAAWQPLRMGVAEGGENEDGDKFGRSHRVTFVDGALPGCLITVSYCAVQYAAWESDEWGVERTVAWSVAEAPGADPWFDEAEVDLVNEIALDGQDEADALASAFAEGDSRAPGAGDYGCWDGRPFAVEGAV